MFESVIMMLIYLCLFAIVVYIALYVLGVLGVTIPPRVIQIFWLIVGLVVLLMVFRILAPSLGGLHFPSAHGITACEGYSNCNNEVRSP